MHDPCNTRRPALYPESDQRDQVFHAALAQLLIEAADGKFLEVFRVAVRGQSLCVAVLLIDEHGVGIVLQMVGNVADASGSWREAAASTRRVSTTSSRSSEANFIRTAKLIMKAASFFAWACSPGHISSLCVNAIEGGGKFRQQHGLVPVRSGGDHSDFGAALTLLKAQILACCRRQFFKLRDSLG